MAILRTVHRYVGLALLALWFIQAATGALMVFHWEIGDALIAGARVPTDWPALERRVAAIEAGATGEHVRYVYATAGAPDRYDLTVEDAAGQFRVVRTDGAGTVLGTWPSGHDYARAPLIDAAVVLHQSLFAGHAGRLLLGASALVLLGNLLVGVRLAWPRPGTWGRALRPPRSGPPVAQLYGWHRAVGLWLALPALVIVGTGVLQAFDDAVAAFLRLDTPAPSFAPAPGGAPPTGDGSPAAPAVGGSKPIGLARAVSAALARVPGSAFAGLAMPGEAQPWYRIRVRQGAEWRRAYGTTIVDVSSADARAELTSDALTAPFAQRFVSATWPVHTGEAAGLAGRLLALATALALVAGILLGGLLWWRRRRPAR